jgi:glycerol-3-phosphate acyltransferase PlsX
MIIAVDAMGGDFSPKSTVEGAILAAKDLKHKILLVGDKNLILEEILKYKKKRNYLHYNIEIINATETIHMNEHPVMAVRSKKNSSIAICAKLVSNGDADCFVSIGNSGAVMTAALFYLKRIKGILRPAISTVFPTISGNCIISDIGANVDCKPEHLVQFGIMSSLFCEKVNCIKNPKVGLLSIGKEPTKGNELTFATFDLFKKTNINFIGNIEGMDIPKAKADVVICDGFVGNIILKFGEGITEMMIKLVKKEFKKNPMAWASIPFMWIATKYIKKRVDYSEFGGAPLLGVNGVCIVGHGSSNGKAVKNAIFAGVKAVEQNIVDDIKKSIINYNKIF